MMWLLAQVDSDEPTYNIAWALWLDGTLDVSALERAWDAALARHEALRTTFRNESGVPVQVIEDEPAVRPLPVSSVEHVAAGERESAAWASISDLAKASIDLATGAVARAALIRLSEQAHVLAVVMHHIVADGWSFRILFDELSADYEAISRGADPVSAEPPIQYADFAIWQIEHAEDGGYSPAERFWRAELAGAQPSLALPTDEPYHAHQTFAASHVDNAIDATLADGLRRRAGHLGTTRFAVLLAAYAVVLSRLTGSDDLLIAVPMAARTRPETESVVGLFVNTVPIRIRIDQDRTLADLVRSVHNATARALAHQELPFPTMVELAGRADRQIKIRGYRIESGEVEAALRGQDDIAQAVVSVRGGGADVRLVGYLVTRSGTDRPPAGLRERLREVLPDYMVPAAFVVLRALPLTGSGKIDHRALPEPDWAAVPGRVSAAPRTPTESQLAAIFAELLALSAPVGVGDNFFALGGHSLTATRLMARVRAVYGVDLPVRTLFADPTVAGLALALAAPGSGAQAADPPLTLVPGERR